MTMTKLVKDVRCYECDRYLHTCKYMDEALGKEVTRVIMCEHCFEDRLKGELDYRS